MFHDYLRMKAGEGTSTLPTSQDWDDLEWRASEDVALAQNIGVRDREEARHAEMPIHIDDDQDVADDGGVSARDQDPEPRDPIGVIFTQAQSNVEEDEEGEANIHLMSQAST